MVDLTKKVDDVENTDNRIVEPNTLKDPRLKEGLERTKPSWMKEGM